MVMDLGPLLRLGAPMDDNGHDELISRLFALLTMKCEDGAAEATKGQGRDKDPQTIERLANHIQSVGEEIALIAEAARCLAMPQGL